VVDLDHRDGPQTAVEIPLGPAEGEALATGDRSRPLVVEDDRIGGVGQVSLEIGALRSVDALRRPLPAVQPADAGSIQDPG
jgi:hypothetical protein